MDEDSRSAAAPRPASSEHASPERALALASGPDAATPPEGPDPLPRTRLDRPTPRAMLAGITGVVLLLLGMTMLDTLTPFVVGLLLVYLLAPAVDRLALVRVGQRTIPRWLAILLLYAGIVVGLGASVTLVLGPMNEQVQRFVDQAPAFLAAAQDWYARLDLPGWARDGIDQALEGIRSGGEEGGMGLAGLLPLARSVASTVISAFGFLIIPFWAFYLLRDLPRLARSFEQALPPSWRRDGMAVMGIVDHTFGRWIRGQLILGLVVGVATFLGLLLLGELVDPVFLSFAVLLAVVAGVLELVPVIGPILSMIPTLILALTAQDPMRAALAVVLLYLVVQQVENHVLVPKIQGDAVELHPSLVILALIVGSALFGILGAILSVPVTAAVRDIYRYWFRRMSEDDPAIPDPDASDMAHKTRQSPLAERGEQHTEATATP
ncbi:MAG: AI-2E family transporter [Chloroflexi bacterium]|nr:AI-2E family transporter [Chloroflexota bacterium]